MKIRKLPFAAIVSAVAALGCSGRVNADGADAGTPQGGAGSGGVTASPGGKTSSGGSAGAAGRVSTGGAGTGGAPAGGTAGGGAGEASCPATFPSIGSPCPSGLKGNCSYGSGCCGLVLFCGASGWMPVPFGCQCPTPPPPPADAGPIACGSETCSANEVCVQPAYNSCGPQPLCVDELDGGGCPSGTMFVQYCSGSSSGGCVATPKPGPPHCAPMPSSCGSSPSCACLPHDVCGPSGVDECSAVHERHVDCLCTAP